MKVKEIRELSREELHVKLFDFKEELFNLRFQHEIGQLENHSVIKATKHKIARIKTVMSDLVNKHKKDKS